MYMHMHVYKSLYTCVYNYICICIYTFQSLLLNIHVPSFCVDLAMINTGKLYVKALLNDNMIFNFLYGWILIYP